MRVSAVRKQEWDTPMYLIQMANPDVLLKIDWMMADIIRTHFYSQFSIG